MTFLPLEEINIQDAVLEFLSLIAYIFLFVMVFYARKKNKIFASKGFPLMVLAIIMGIIGAFMDFFTEFYWFDDINNYIIFKTAFSTLQITSLGIFALSLLLVFMFTKFMLGEEEQQVE
ncbi:MAG: hypothetical protein ACTSU4_05300 [Promethearchaeota archaeon]